MCGTAAGRGCRDPLGLRGSSSWQRRRRLPASGCVVGATDRKGEQVSDAFYKVESFGATLYHLLGIDPHTVVNTLNNRPIRLINEDAPLIREAIA